MAEFKWDSEVEIGTVAVNEYQKRIVKVCELNGETYLNVAKVKKIKGEDQIIGGWSEKLSTVEAICSLFNEYSKE